MAKLYERGNSKSWKIFKGSRNEDLNGEYSGTFTFKRPGEEEQRVWAISLVAHKGNQFMLVSTLANVLIISNFKEGDRNIIFHDLKNNVTGSGTLGQKTLALNLDTYSIFSLQWESEDGISSGSWKANLHSTEWFINYSGQYTVQVENAHRVIFPRKTFIMTLTDNTFQSMSHSFVSGDVLGISESKTIKLTGKKVQVRKFHLKFNSSINNIEGSGILDLKQNNQMFEGTWKAEDFWSSAGDSGTWTMKKIE